MAVGEPLAPMEASLRNVALILAGVSTGIWLLAAAVGRRLCNRALFPMTRMAKAACVMTAADRDHRLPSPGTGDELDALAGSFNGLLDRLHQEFERQKRFTGDASHQLRTPLTALLGQIEVGAAAIARPTNTSVSLTRSTAKQSGSDRSWSRCCSWRAPRPRPNGPTCNPSICVSWVHEHLREWSNHERAADLHEEPRERRLDVRQGSPSPARPVARQPARQLPASTARRERPSTFASAREEDVVTLAVQDRGWGLAADDRPHVFEPFFRSAEARRRGLSGVGLGLAVVQRIAAVFGGTITVESEPGRGSRFMLRLPVAKASIPTFDQSQPGRAVEPARAC